MRETLQKYRLTLVLMVISALAIVCTAIIVSRIHGNLAEQNLLKLSEANTVRDAEHLQHMLRHMGPFTLDFLAGPEGLPATFRTLIAGLNIVKINLFDLDSKVVWSTDPRIIGTINHHTSLIDRAINGDTASTFVRNMALVDVDGVRQRLDTVETYIPIRGIPSGRILGVMELYRDVSQDVSQQVNASKSSVVWTTIMTMGGLFLALMVFTTMADVTLHRANRRELLLIASQLAERQRTEEAIQESEERFRRLIEHSVQGIIIHQGDTPIFVNQAYADLLGYETPDDILERGTLMPLFAPHERERILTYRRIRTHGGEAPVQYEYQGMCKDGSLIWLDNKVTVVNWRGESAIQCTVFDITERKRAQEELETRARQQAVVADLGRRALAATELDVLIHDTVTAIAQTLDVPYVKVMELLPDGDALWLRAGVGWQDGLVGSATVDARDNSQAGYTLRSNEPVVVDDLRTETRFSGPQVLHEHKVISGMSVVIAGTSGPFGVMGVHTIKPRTFTKNDVHFFQAVANVLAEAIERHRAEQALRAAHHDLERRVQERTIELSHTLEVLQEHIAERQRSETQLQRSQEQLRALSDRMLSVQEEERTRIAREIHDELGQALTALKIDLAWLQRRLPAPQETLRQKTTRMAQLIDSTTHSMRRLATTLRPRVLDDLGLVAALEWQVQDFQERTGIVCVLAIDPEDVQLDSACSTSVFRVVQEALTNVARHAHASRVEIGLHVGAWDLCLEIRDNGRGISQQAVNDPQSLGLLGIRERVLRWHGEVRIQGSPDQGTVITVCIPLTASTPVVTPDSGNGEHQHAHGVQAGIRQET